LQPFTGNGDVSIEVKNTQVGHKTITNKSRYLSILDIESKVPNTDF
jgi:hypothetical protein